jgi:TP901 family phage tail tape measure protein
MDDVSEGMRDKMAGAAREVSQITTTSSTKAAESYYFLASAGLDAQESIKALPEVARFAQAGMFGMQKATDLATDAQSALGLTSENTAENTRQLGRVMDVLVNANQDANASVEQFSSALTNRAAPALKAANKSLEEGVGVLATFADQGIKGQKAGQRLSQVLRLLSKNAAENTEQFRELGLIDAQGNLNSFSEIIRSLTEDMRGMSDAQQSARLEQLGFTARVQQAIKPLLGNSEAIKEYTESARDAGGATKEVADKQMKSFNAQMKLVRNAVQNAGQEIGEILAPAVHVLAGIVRSATQAFSQMPDILQKVVVGFGTALAALGPLLFALGTIPTIKAAVASGFGVITAAAGKMATAFSTAWAAVTGPVGIVLGSIAAVGGATYLIYDNWKGVKSFFGDLLSSVVRIFAGMKGAILGLLKGLWPAAQMIFLEGIADLIGPLKKFAQWLGADSLAEGIEGFQGQMRDLIPKDELASAEAEMRTGIQMIEDEVAKGAGAVMDAGEGIVDAAADIATQAKEKFQGIFSVQPGGGEGEASGKSAEQLLGGGGEMPGKDGMPGEGGGGSAIQPIVSDADALAKKVPDNVDLVTESFKSSEKAIQSTAGTFNNVKVANPMGAIADNLDVSLAQIRDFSRGTQEELKSLAMNSRLAAKKFLDTKMAMVNAAERIGRVVEQGFERAAAGMLKGIGKMATGQASLKDVMNNVLSTLADMAIRVGKIAIGTAITVKGIKNALQKLEPAQALAAGAALIALGAAVKGALSSAASGKGGSGATPFRQASGGGEIASRRTSGRRGGRLTARVEGSDLVFALEKERDRQSK